MSRTDKQCVLFFVKAPERGQVKTRLAASIGPDDAVALYRSFVEDLLGMLDVLEAAVVCCYHPADAEAAFVDWLGHRRVYTSQRGDDLGRRMANAFRDAFESGFSEAVLIGSDSPDLAPTIIEQAFDALASHDIVIGPSSDGGYYLIGFTADGFLPEAFENIDWSTDRAFSQTLSILNRHQRAVFALAQWHDIDTRSDLDDLIDRSRDTFFRNSRTSRFLRGCAWSHPGKESEG